MILSGKWFFVRFSRHLLLFALLAGILLFVHAGLLVPLQKEIAAKETAWQSERPKIGQLTLLKTTQEDLVLFRERLPEETALPELVSFVSESAAAHHLSIPAISYQPEKIDAPGLMKVLISFNVKGNYREIRNLIYRLEQSRYFLVIENLVLASSVKEGEAIQLQLRIAAYFRVNGEKGAGRAVSSGRRS
ncbi:MAG: hypothetical protein EPO39_10535 [Candidatus Manganitrophaceae bacterium]|nr:MAG: hypothetical protein EPO39_10535 [Candidatus Manganitrophaceae bacterium]